MNNKKLMCILMFFVAASKSSSPEGKNQSEEQRLKNNLKELEEITAKPVLVENKLVEFVKPILNAFYDANSPELEKLTNITTFDLLEPIIEEVLKLCENSSKQEEKNDATILEAVQLQRKRLTFNPETLAFYKNDSEEYFELGNSREYQAPGRKSIIIFKSKLPGVQLTLSQETNSDLKYGVDIFTGLTGLSDKSDYKDFVAVGLAIGLSNAKIGNGGGFINGLAYYLADGLEKGLNNITTNGSLNIKIKIAILTGVLQFLNRYVDHYGYISLSNNDVRHILPTNSSTGPSSIQNNDMSRLVQTYKAYGQKIDKLLESLADREQVIKTLNLEKVYVGDGTKTIFKWKSKTSDVDIIRGEQFQVIYDQTDTKHEHPILERTANPNYNCYLRPSRFYSAVNSLNPLGYNRVLQTFKSDVQYVYLVTKDTKDNTDFKIKMDVSSETFNAERFEYQKAVFDGFDENKIPQNTTLLKQCGKDMGYFLESINNRPTVQTISTYSSAFYIFRNLDNCIDAVCNDKGLSIESQIELLNGMKDYAIEYLKHYGYSQSWSATDDQIAKDLTTIINDIETYRSRSPSAMGTKDMDRFASCLIKLHKAIQ